MDIFQHTPLDRSKEYIRLLRFLDQPPSSELDHFALDTYDIPTAPRFVALIYTWGRPEPSHKIIVDGSPLPIRENLQVSLKVLRSFFPNKAPRLDLLRRWECIGRTPPQGLLQENGYPLIWIDAICINQSDASGKNHQVNMMGRIFSTAERVISWVGDEANNSSSVMKAIRVTPHTRFCAFEVRQAMEAFAKRPYWHRMWDIQDFVLPQDLLILCGHEGAWWEDLLHFWHDGKVLSGADRRSQCFSEESVQSIDEGGLAALIITRRSRRHGPLNIYQYRPGTLSVDEIMGRSTYGECSDPRDRTYALLALMEPLAGVEPLMADYKISAEDLYYKVIGYLGPLKDNGDSRRFRKELGEALDGSLWASTEAAKVHEVVCEIVELGGSDKESFYASVKSSKEK